MVCAQSVYPGHLYLVVLEVGPRLPGCSKVGETDLYYLFVVSLSVGWLCQGAGLRPLLLFAVVWLRWPLLVLVVAKNSTWHRRGVPVLRTMSGMLSMA